jgi:hypothetical protein
LNGANSNFGVNRPTLNTELAIFIGIFAILLISMPPGLVSPSINELPIRKMSAPQTHFLGLPNLPATAPPGLGWGTS